MNARLVLQALGEGQPVSGTKLAGELGITRTAVWKQVESLRARGLPVQAHAGTGYALPWRLELLERERIIGALPTPDYDRLGSLQMMWEPDSTSSALRSRRAQAPDLSVVLAEGQRAGRGRRGRGWLSPPGLNLYLSVLKRFDGGFSTLSGLSLALGVMLMRAIKDVGIGGAGLKWPNDLVAGTAKFGGILVELDGECDGPCAAVIGVGINLRVPSEVRARMDQPVTALAELNDGTPPPRNLFAARVITRLVQGLDVFATAGFADFAREYASHDLLHGHEVRVDGAHGAWSGRAAGVDKRGGLCIDTDAGRHVLDSAESSVRLL